MQYRPFQPAYETTQNVAMDGTAKTLTFGRPSDANTTVHLFVSGTATVFVKLDGQTPTTSNAMPLAPGSTQTFSVPVGAAAVVKAIGAAGSTLYATLGSGS